MDPPPLLRLPPPLLPELRLPPELDFERELLLPTDPELLVPELFFWLVPDRGFTELRVFLVPEVPFWLLRGLTLLPRVLSVLLPDWPLRPEFQTRVPFLRGSTGLMFR